LTKNLKEIPSSPTKGASQVRVAIRPEFGWRHACVGDVRVWVKGYSRGVDAAAVAVLIAALPKLDVDQTVDLIRKLDGHFAIVAAAHGVTFAAVDWVRSIPVAFAHCGDHWCIDDQALRLRDHAGFGPHDIDADAALSVAMAGYTVDIATLYTGLQQLGPGEFVLFDGGESPQRHRYYCYRPWRADKPAFDAAVGRKALAETTLELIDRTMSGVGDRTLVVPLSAGYDSRLIVSAAHHLGHRNIRAFAYGHPDNHEAKASQAIAERLGIPWRFVPTSIASMRDYFLNGTHAAYCAFADTLQSVPFVQDLTSIACLKADGFVPADAVIANGNSGDYISGAHIVPEMRTLATNLTEQARLKRITTALMKKHFGLWSALQTPKNLRTIERQLLGSLSRADAQLGDPADDYGIYEYLEFQDRQCKFVITGQRIYEFLGHEWRLPLWDKTYLDFFEKVPLAHKVGQRLYAEMLVTENWGNAWHDVPVNAKTVRPHWLRPLRFLAKAAHAPLGRVAWHRFERRYIQYWMGGNAQSAIKPYRAVARDRRGARNAISWLSEAYLNGHSIDFGAGELTIAAA
jgi:asparagine synthase (glutamine-hydrolysing)